MSGCGLALSELLFDLESGGEPQPLFFRDRNCEGPAFPFFGSDQLQYTEAGITWFNHYICGRQASRSQGENTFLGEANCVPAFQSAILPNTLRATFLARWDNAIQSSVTEQGQYNMSTASGAWKKNNNVWSLTKYIIQSPNDLGTASQRWTRLSGRSPVSKDNDCSIFSIQTSTSCDAVGQPNNCPLARAADFKANYSQFSCGTTFWPTFTRLQIQPPAAEGKSATFPTSNDKYLGVDADSSLFAFPENETATIGAVVYRSSCNTGSCTQVCPWGSGATLAYTALDCLSTCDECPDCTDATCAPGDGNNSCGNSCVGGDEGGNVSSVKVFRTEKWSVEQLNACLGKPVYLGGVQVTRYGNSTPACDPIMENLCSLSSELDANPALRKACFCILEQKKLERQFAGLDLPVQCFLSVCNDDDRGVYKTTSQATPCSARLCVQTLAINGSAIAAEGIQNLSCNNVVYNVSNVSVSPSQVPIVTPSDNGDAIQLDTTFWIALGMLGLMLFLIIVYVIRRIVVSRAAKKATQLKVTRLLRQKLQLSQ